MKKIEGAKYQDYNAALTKKIYRILGSYIAIKLKKLHIHPIQVTLFRILFIPIIAYLFYLGNYITILSSCILLQIFLILDKTDGSLARITKNETNIGAWFDFIADAIIYTVVFMTLGLGLFLKTNNLIYWLLIFLTITSYLFKTVIYHTFTRLLPSSNFMEKEKSKYKFLRNFFYEDHFIAIILTIGAIINQVYYTLILLSIIGWLYVIGMLYKLTWRVYNEP